MNALWALLKLRPFDRSFLVRTCPSEIGCDISVPVPDTDTETMQTLPEAALRSESSDE